MTTILRQRIGLHRAMTLLLLFLVVFSGILPCFAPIHTVSAGWDGMATIAIIPSSDEFLDTAAQELETYLEEMSGWSWTIVQGDVGDPAIRLDVNPAAPEFADRSDEAVRIISDASGIRIIGKTSIAVRHGAYILLEKLGVRWFFKHSDWTYTPSSLADLGALDEIHEPDFFWRRIWSSTTVGRDETADWNMRNRLFGSRQYPINHNYSDIIAKEEWYPDHMEWGLPSNYAGSGANQLRCDNETVIARAKDYADTYLAQAAATNWEMNDTLAYGSVPISPNDGLGWDPPWDTTQGVTDKVMGLANTVAAHIAEAFPACYVGVYCYTVYSEVATQAMEPNVIVLITTDYNQGSLTLLEQIDGYVAKNCVVGIYDYIDIWVWYQDPPAINFDRSELLKIYADKGITVFSGESGDAWCGRGISYYLTAKLLWDTTLDIDELLDDFYTKAFGAAATTMERHFKLRSYEASSSSDSTIAKLFDTLDEAETDAVGDDAVLARIRQLQYYTRYLWLYKNVGKDNLDLEDLQAFYIFTTKCRDLYIVFYNYLELNLRTELIERGMTNAEVIALQDFVVPTAQEASDWMDEALAEFAGTTRRPDVIHPRRITLEALGDTGSEVLDPISGGTRSILIPSEGSENITVNIKGKDAALLWLSPQGLLLDERFYDEIGSEWTPIEFEATDAGTYILHSRTATPHSYLCSIDVPDRPASIIGAPGINIIKPDDDPVTRNAPAPENSVESQYFYVPAGTTEFWFGSDKGSGTITDPDSNETAFDNTVTPTETVFSSPTAGLWKVVIDLTGVYSGGHFWVDGIPPLFWHDPEYLLVQGNGAPVANDQSVITTVDAPVDITLSASDLNGDPLTYTIVTNPSQGVLSGTPPVVTYAPNSGFVGSDSFTFKANDSSSDSNLATVSITVTDNNYPIADAIGDKSVNEGELLEYTVSATDPDGDPLVYSASGLSSGASFDPNNQTFSWTPRYDQAGVYSVHFEVSDGELADSKDVTITVVQLYEDWDINGDGAADVLDMVLVGQHWGEAGLTGWIREDANEDGTVNVLDMIIIGQNSTE